MEFKWDEALEQAVLFLDGIEHDKLPWLSPDFRLDETELPLYQTTLNLDSIKVTCEYKPFEWEPHVLYHHISEIHGSRPVEKIDIVYMSQDSSVTNEMFDVLSHVITPEAGYSYLRIGYCYGGMLEPFDSSVMDSFA